MGILGKPDRCQLAKVRSMPVREIRFYHKGKPEPYLINEEHKIILRQLDKQKSEECDLTNFTTDYPEIMIIPETQDTVLKLHGLSTHPESINLDCNYG